MDKLRNFAQVQAYDSWAVFAASRKGALIVESILLTKGFKIGPMHHSQPMPDEYWYYILEPRARLEELAWAFAVAWAFLPPRPVFFSLSPASSIKRLDIPGHPELSDREGK